MADSDNSRTLPSVTRRTLLSTSAAWLLSRAANVDAAPGAALDSAGTLDPVLLLWREWMTAHDEVDRLCRRQQRLESCLIAAVGFPLVDLVLPGQEKTAPAFTMEEIDTLLGDGPDTVAARMQARDALTDWQRAWDVLDERLGYSRAKEVEGKAFACQEERASALWSEPARSIAGAAAKLHAVLHMGDEDGLADEFPWPQIRAVLTDLVGMDNVHVAL